MNDTITQPSAENAKSRRRGKVRAILAGGLIAALGIGGTLATWNTGVAGFATFVGQETAPSASTGLLEIQDSNGNWVTYDGTNAAFIAAVTMSKPDQDGLRYGMAESKVRMTGLAEGDTYVLSSKVTGTANTAAAGSVAAEVRLSPLSAGCDIDSTDNDWIVSGLSAPTLVGQELDVKTNSTQFTGNFEKKLCIDASSVDLNAPVLTADDKATWTVELSATPTS